ncbi:MAG: YhcH/YjgK/YiaL family protein [Oscillospiraceae bacterium]|nr:YhcH/YjgK/YiaL family protein [Oscillospiraceae bacterium]
MIFDKLTNIPRYLGMNPKLDLALNYIFAHQDALEGHVELLGADVYGNSFTYETVTEADTFFEAHAKFADIQIMTEGTEFVDVSDIDLLNVDEAHPDRDFWALSGPAQLRVRLEPGWFLLVLPGNAHKLKIQDGNAAAVTKAVFKVKVLE